MLVVENGCGFAGGAVDRDDLLEEFVARIEVLALGVAGVGAVLGDQQHAIDGEVVATQG